MDRRLKLHSELLEFYPNVYFQPPANFKMEYPCLVYSKVVDHTAYADDQIYKERQAYNITVIERDPDSDIPRKIRSKFNYSRIIAHHTIDNLHQTVLNIYY